MVDLAIVGQVSIAAAASSGDGLATYSCKETQQLKRQHHIHHQWLWRMFLFFLILVLQIFIPPPSPPPLKN